MIVIRRQQYVRSNVKTIDEQITNTYDDTDASLPDDFKLERVLEIADQIHDNNQDKTYT